MATPSGQISLSDVNAELNLSPTALITMNDAAVRTLAGVGGSGTVISMQDLQNKSNRVAIPLTISTNSYNYDVYTNRGPTYSAGTSDITVTINPGVVVGSTSTGSYAFLVPSAFNPGDTVTVVNNGVIQGRGGDAGAGGGNFQAGLGGSVGGAAVYVNRSTTITNNGTLAGGGGGAGGGGFGLTSIQPNPEQLTLNYYAGGGGGGGGAGFDGGTGGSGGSVGGSNDNRPGSPGASGTSPAGGGGGGGGTNGQVRAGAGGTGGGRGSSGASGQPQVQGSVPAISGGSGGGAGAYIVGNPFVTYPATGTRLGPSS